MYDESELPETAEITYKQLIKKNENKNTLGNMHWRSNNGGFSDKQYQATEVLIWSNQTLSAQPLHHRRWSPGYYHYTDHREPRLWKLAPAIKEDPILTLGETDSWFWFLNFFFLNKMILFLLRFQHYAS